MSAPLPEALLDTDTLTLDTVLFSKEYDGVVKVTRAADATAPRELDVVEVTTDELGVPRGTRGTVVDHLGDGAFLLEIVDDSGQTTALTAVAARDVRVVWRAAGPAGREAAPVTVAPRHG